MAKRYKTFEKGTVEELLNEITYDKINHLEENPENDDPDYLKLCMYESHRIEPPIAHSSSLTVTEDCIIGGVKVKQGE